MRRTFIYVALMLALFTPAAADTADGYWDAALGLYLSWDEALRLYLISDPGSDVIRAYEPDSGLFYLYDPAADRFVEVGYVDAAGNVVETGGYGAFDEAKPDPAEYEATLEMMRLYSDEILRAIDDMNGPAYGDTGGYDP
jgi:hypothetical protein